VAAVRRSPRFERVQVEASTVITAATRTVAPSSAHFEMLKAGQDIVIQIAKEPLGKKGARITSHVALPGRFLVYMPTIDHIGVSRKIPAADNRSRLRRLVGEARGAYPEASSFEPRPAALPTKKFAPTSNSSARLGTKSRSAANSASHPRFSIAI